MYDLSLNIVAIIIILVNSFFAFNLLRNTLGSHLFANVSYLIFLAMIIVALNIAMAYVVYDFIFISAVLFNLYLYQLYRVWMITYNEVDNPNKIFVLIITTLNIILLVLNTYYPELINIYLAYFIDYRLLSLLILIILFLNFFNFKKQATTYQLNYLPLIVLSLFLVEVAKIFNILTVNEISLIFGFLNSVILLIYMADYKNSFYY